MRRVAAALAAVLLCVGPVGGSSAARDRVERAPVGSLKVQLDAMPIGAVVTMLMRDVMGVPYVISSDVLDDDRAVSVDLTIPPGEVPQRVVEFLRAMALEVVVRSGTVYVSKGGRGVSAGASGAAFAPPVQIGAAVPSGSPLAPPASGGRSVGSPAIASPRWGVAGASGVGEPQAGLIADPLTIAVVTPAHRSVRELAEVIEGVLPELTMAARSGSEPRGGEIVDQLEPDRLVLSGSRAMLDRAIELVLLLDKPRPTVEIRAVVFEVRTNEARASALSLLAEIGDLEIGSRVGAAPGEQFLRIATGGLQAVLSATRGDGRFQIVAEPSLAALSGTVARINSGSQVPTVGAVSYGEDGVPIRSIIYRDSGVSLTVRPVVRGGEIELAVEQERSSFERTTTGVDESPTLNRASASAKVSIRPGETIAIAGLDERSESTTRSGFLGGLIGSRDRTKGEGQLLLLLQADLAQDQRAGVALVEFIEPEVDPEVAKVLDETPA